MLVNSIMLSKKNLTTVSPEENLENALSILNENDFLSIPVVKDDKFCGVIFRHKIYSFYFDIMKNDSEKINLRNINVEEVMDKNVPTIDPHEEVEVAVQLLANKNLPFLALIGEDGTLKGILTHKIIFEQFIDALGFNKGQKISIQLYDTPGQISKISKIIREGNGNIISFIVLDPKSVMEVGEAVIRMRTDNLPSIVKKLKEAGFKVQ